MADAIISTGLDEQEVEELKESFRTIQANLVDEEIKQYTKGETEKVRYDKLKRLAYDIDDVLDEYKTAILKSKIETDHQAQTPSTSSSLSSELHNTPSTTSKIKGLNKRVAREKDFLSLAIDENGGTDSKLERTKTTSFIDEFVVSGRDHDQVDLIDRLLRKQNLSDYTKTAFWGRSEEDCENLESIGTEIVRKCGGLPLAIKTLANLLRSKGTKEQWQRILDSEMWELEEDPEIFKKHFIVASGGIERGQSDGIEGGQCHENVRHLSLIAHGHRGLPLGMEKLINLRHLLNAGSYRITLPKGMKRLTNLQTLEELELLDGNNGRRLSSSDSFSLADLGNLIHLRGKLDIDGLGDVAANELREARLSTKTGLRELSLNFSGGSNKKSQKGIEDDALVLQALDPPQQLLSLEISHCKSLAFPNWMTSLTLLKRVYLYAFYNWESLPPLGKLPFLESLTINQLDKVKKVGEEFLGIETSSSSVDHIDFAFFPNLKVLEFYQMKGWDEWEYECEKQLLLRSRGGEGEGHHSSNTIPTIMPILQHLTIWNCPKLKALPDHLLHSTTLQFTIYNSPIRDLQLPNSLPW
ncbi:NB-ARC domain-containing protein [Corchorus olitorius]|uniref:NB-ARC domain-containing protein n=1 Tax=Corchorus olitorius TaxID=93759 RepID=A0A1R3GJ48_9ROSI|nr:NB-ARC domain-containing protein [Corchorus olitorius]